MAKYYFLILGFFCGLYGYSQDCGSPDLLGSEKNWTGHLDRFGISPDGGWRLQDTAANVSSIVFRPDFEMTGFQYSISLDFPPSTSNRFGLTIDIRDPSTADSASITLSIGEPGNQDGLHVEYRLGNRVVSERELWTGDYGMGANRASWQVSIEPTGFLIKRIGDQRQELIPWTNQPSIGFSISRIELRCIYTKTRSNHFTVHHLFPYTNENVAEWDPLPGDLFISESRLIPDSAQNFIELYNILDVSVCLRGWRLEVNGDIIDLPSIPVEPGHHIVITDRESPVVVDQSVKPISVDFPPIDLVNGVEIVLYYFDRLIHGVQIYPSEDLENFQTWEMIDVSQPCRTDNWASSAVERGTPGAENSRFSTLDRPTWGFVWETPTTAGLRIPYLVFDPGGLANLLTANFDFELENNTFWGEPSLVFLDELSRTDSVMIRVEGAFGGCLTSYNWDTLFATVPPVRGKVEGLQITEIMYEPIAGCPEYLEITNLEGRDTWWDGLHLLKNQDNSLPIPIRGGWRANQSRVFTGNRMLMLECYPETPPALIFQVDLFALNNEGAELELSTEDPGKRIIDQTTYSSDDHNYLIRETTGVVLERNIFGTQGNNWRSGFVHLGYRSPGFLPEWDLSKEIEVEFSSSVIYTGTEREPSRLEISVGAENLDGSITIEIFDLNGRNVQTLANAVPVQGGEVFIWAGRSSNGRLLPEGLYLFWIDYFDLVGHKKTIKKTCVLSNN